MPRYVEVPIESLSAAAADGLIGEFVSRDGTDHVGDEAERIEDVRRQIARGEVVIVFDFETETSTCMLRRELRRLNELLESE